MSKKKSLLSVTLAASLLMSGLPATGLEPVTAASTAEIKNSVSFRETPSTSGDRIRYLKEGETVTILDQTNAYWYKVKDQAGKVGYVTTIDRYLDVSPSTVSSSIEGNATVVSSVSFRQGPSTRDTRIRYLQAGERVEIVREVNQYWYQIKDQSGTTGYVSSNSKYVKRTSSAPPAQPEASQPAGEAGIGTGTIQKSVSFRTGPSTSDRRMRYLQSGEQVTILDEVNRYWYKVQDREGTVGYTSTHSTYIHVQLNTGDDQSDSEPAPTAPSEPSDSTSGSDSGEIVRSVSFRKGPSTSDARIRYLQTGEQVQILSQVNEYWYQVKDRHGTVGYVSSSASYMKTDYVEQVDEQYESLPASKLAQLVIDAGMKYLGTPYEFGSSRHNVATFDCSDFVRQAFKDALGLSLPSDSRKQAQFVKDLGQMNNHLSQLQPGDILFFSSYEGVHASDYAGVNKSTARVTHNGIYLGNGQILHTYSKDSGGVRIDTIADSHWEYRFLYGGSPVQNES
ncbi:C40 family peptidase [Marinicrinis sediminis]|uniref:SH3 domain-containing protein n=1 Tax=Marinicrinis sediminis TaxID=1652465 RepID=A0ABW5RB17_9BACL